MRGFADGIGGLVTTPLKEAKTGGVGGFFKGERVLLKGSSGITAYRSCCQ